MSPCPDRTRPLFPQFSGSLAGVGLLGGGALLSDALTSASLHETFVPETGPPLRAEVDKRHGGLTLVPVDAPTAARRAIAASQMRSMLLDTDRCEKYAKAIKRCIELATARSGGTSPRVLDIGTGTGLLAMIAAREGAKHVDAVEMFLPLAQLAESVVRENALEAVVDVYGGHKSTDMSVEEHERYDILVTEIFDSALLGEAVLPVMSHARQKLLKSNALTVPASAKMYAQLVESAALFGTWHDLSAETFPFHRSQASFKCNGGSRVIPVQLDALSEDDYTLLSDAFELFSFSLSPESGELPPESVVRRLEVPVTSAGVPHAVLLWWELDLVGDGSIMYSSKLGAERWQDHWLQGVFPLPLATGDYREGEVVTLSAGHTDMEVWFSLDPKARSPRLCSCGFHSLRGGPARICALGRSYRTDRMRQRLNKTLVYHLNALRATEGKQGKGRSGVRVIDISTGSSLCGLLAAEIGSAACSVHVTSLETEADESSMDCLLYQQVADTWERDGKLYCGADDKEGAGRSTFSIVHSVEELEASMDASTELFDVLVTEPWHPAMSGYPASLAASIWLRRAALATLLSPRVRCVPAHCAVRAMLVEFADDTLHRSFKSVGTVCGLTHGPLDDLCSTERAADATGYERVSLPLYMYRHRALSVPTDVYSMELADMPPDGVDTRKSCLTVRESGRVDAVAVWTEYDLSRPGRTECVELLWLNDEKRVAKGDSFGLQCRWDRHGLGGFGFCFGAYSN